MNKGGRLAHAYRDATLGRAGVAVALEIVRWRI
jgi:hypothetical protein